MRLCLSRCTRKQEMSIRTSPGLLYSRIVAEDAGSSGPAHGSASASSLGVTPVLEDAESSSPVSSWVDPEEARIQGASNNDLQLVLACAERNPVQGEPSSVPRNDNHVSVRVDIAATGCIRIGHHNTQFFKWRLVPAWQRKDCLSADRRDVSFHQTSQVHHSLPVAVIPGWIEFKAVVEPAVQECRSNPVLLDDRPTQRDIAVESDVPFDVQHLLGIGRADADPARIGLDKYPGVVVCPELEIACGHRGNDGGSVDSYQNLLGIVLNVFVNSSRRAWCGHTQISGRRRRPDADVADGSEVPAYRRVVCYVQASPRGCDRERAAHRVSSLCQRPAVRIRECRMGVDV